MGSKMWIFVFVAILIGGCSDRMSYHHTAWDAQGNKTEETKIIHTSSPGNTSKEGIEVTIGDEDNPKASLKVGSSTANMDKFYDTIAELTQLMEALAAKYVTGGTL